MPLILGAVEQNTYRNKLRGDKCLNVWRGIRHGIQCNATRSMLAAEISEHEPPLLLRPRQGLLKARRPHDC
jgi:hypothetical protein